MVYLGTNKVNNKWLGTNLLNKKKMFPGLLDTYPATAAYSAGRRLKSDQTYAMTIRRESDNAETDIGFDANGDTDVAAIEEFGGYNLLSYTEDLLRPEWFFSGIGSLTKVAGYSDKDGGDKAFLLTETNGTNPVALAQNYYSDETVLVNETYTGSFYYRNSSSVGNRIRLIETGVPFGVAKQSLVELIPSLEWQRVECSIIFTENYIGVRFDFLIDPSESVEVCFPQLVKSFFAKEYQHREAGGASDCFVPLLVDATGNGNGATQSVATEQPKIYNVETTSVVTENGKPALEWPNELNNKHLANSNQLLNVGDIFVVASSSNLGSFSNDYLGIISAFTNVSSDNAGVILTGGLATTLNMYSTDKIWDSLSLNGQDAETTPNIFPVFPTIENQTLLNTFQPTSKTINGVLVGGDRNLNERGWQGTIQEVILFDSDQLTNRTALENNINNYYGIY